MLIRSLCLFVVCTVSSPFTLASEALAQQAGCGMCHAAAEQRMGPSWQAIAARYKGDATAPATLAAHVRAGSKGVWGQVPMMPTPPERVSDEQLQTLLAWVLNH